MRENTPKIRYDRLSLLNVLADHLPGGREQALSLAQEYERVRAEGEDKPCQSKVWHGPGHQSSTFCQQTGGESAHDVSDGKNFDYPAGAIVHAADLPSGGFAEWTDDDPYDRY